MSASASSQVRLVCTACDNVKRDALAISGELYTAQWFDRAWLAVRSLETLLTRGGLQRRLRTLFDYMTQKDHQIDVDEWLQTIESTETTLRGWSSVWVYGTQVPELATGFEYRKTNATLTLAVQMQPTPVTTALQSSAKPIVRIRVYERDSTKDEYIDINPEGVGLSCLKVLNKSQYSNMKPPPAEGSFAFGSSVFNSESPIMWLCTDPNKSWLARVRAPRLVLLLRPSLTLFWASRCTRNKRMK